MNYDKIGIIGAMKEEIDLLMTHMEKSKPAKHAGITYIEGIFQGKPVVICQSGVGKVNAAICTQILIDQFQVDSVIFTGVAGAIHPDLNIGDIVISNECMQHDMDVTALGFSIGEIPFSDTSVFPSDPFLMKLAYDASNTLFEGHCKQGRVLSGDQFIADRDQVSQLYTELNGMCTEMEGAAVAQACFLNNIPFVVIRSMSDKADGSAHVNFQEFTIEASENSYRIVEKMITHL